jgi:hypothetical protein
LSSRQPSPGWWCRARSCGREASPEPRSIKRPWLRDGPRGTGTAVGVIGGSSSSSASPSIAPQPTARLAGRQLSQPLEARLRFLAAQLLPRPGPGPVAAQIVARPRS